jgi:hypothetical protein
MRQQLVAINPDHADDDNIKNVKSPPSGGE